MRWDVYTRLGLFLSLVFPTCTHEKYAMFDDADFAVLVSQI